jgi:tRNA(Ile)-lysidine synthetase-like protein
MEFILTVTTKAFAEIINKQKFPHKTTFVVCVSGGVDSMTLVLLFNEFLLNTHGTNKNLIAVTVDHKLIDTSRADADTVHGWLAAKNIAHEILTWEHPPLASRIEEDGRIARYKLLTNFCKEIGSNALYTAHHATDQAETFLMRLRRGSGLMGLCAMRPQTVVNGVLVCRPLLGVCKQDLRDTLQQRFSAHPHLTDLNNSKTELERAFLRHNMKTLEECGLCAKAIITSVNHLQSIEMQLQQLVLVARQKFVKFGVACPREKRCKKKKGATKVVTVNGVDGEARQCENGEARQCGNGEGKASAKEEVLKISLDIIKECIPQVVKMVLRECLKQVGAAQQPICSQAILDRLYDKITKRDFRGATARGCVIRKRGGALEIVEEKRKGGKTVAETQQGEASRGR